MEQHAVPVLRVRPESESLKFYGRLGFAVEWEHRFRDDLPLFASIRRGSWHLFLSEHAGDARPNGLVYLYADDVDALHEGWRSASVLGEPPQDRPWGMRELELLDPDGNRLRVGSSARARDYRAKH